MRSIVKRVLAVIGLAGMLALPAGAAWAADPVTIPSGQNIVDDANVLGSRKGEVQEAIQKTLKDHKYNLYVSRWTSSRIQAILLDGLTP